MALSELTHADQERLRRVGVPAVLVDPVGDFESDVPSIGAGNWAAARHLIERGHRRIGAVTGPMRYLCSQRPGWGYRAALDRVGITYDEEFVAHGNFHQASGLAGGCAADGDRRRQRRAGGQVSTRRPRGSACAFRTTSASSGWVSPALTTVRQPTAELAALAVRTLVGHLDGVALPPGRIELSTALVVRGSTAPPPA